MTCYLIGYFISSSLISQSSLRNEVSLNNKGKIKGEIAGLIPNQAPYGLTSVAPDRWVVWDLADNQFLLNGDGEVMGNVNGLDPWNLNAFYILLNNKIYDWDLNLKYDLIANGAEVMVAMNHGVLMTNEKGETYLNNVSVSSVSSTIH